MSAPLLLLHGFTGSPASWRWVREHLPAAANVLAPPMLGHTGCEASGVHSYWSEVERLAAIVRRVGLEDVHLAGYSLGARLGLGLLLRHEGLFRSATLIGVNPGVRSEAERAERRAADAEWQRLLRTGGLEAFERAWSQLPLWATQTQLPTALRRAQARDRLGHSPEGLARSLEVVGLGAMDSHWERLGQLDVPVVLAVGGEDHKFLRIAREALSELRFGRLEVLPGAGHNLILERPKEIAALLCRGCALEPRPEACPARLEELA